tara:strand:+ start:182 stop:535 length:354 start_codon:yes stop_codon:yes gene_type:complete
MKKTVVHVFHDDDDALTLGTRVPQRIAEVAAENGVAVEVFVFGPAQRHLTVSQTDADAQFNRQIDELISAGIRVGACVNAARAAGVEDDLGRRGIVLSVARDEFLRFTLEGATVISF